MNKDGNFTGQSDNYDRPPPYEYNPGPSAFTYNQYPTDQMPYDKPSAPPQPQVFQQAVPALVLPAPVAPNVQIHLSDQFGAYPQNAVCPHCNSFVLTKTRHVAGALTWLSCIGLMVIGAALCCLIPFCCNSCLNVDHICPNCKRRIGHFSRIC